MLDQFRPWVIPAGVGIVAFGVGYTIGFKRRAGKQIGLLTDTIKDLGSQLDAAESEIRRREEQIEALTVAEGQREKIDYFSITPSEEAVTAVDANIFDADDIPWNWEEETEERTEDAPYTLHRDEFLHEEKGYRQHTLVWYSQDHVLVDEQEIPVPNFERLVGHLNFGHGSGDPDIVYIRNDKHQAEYEICRSPSSYTVDVLGAKLEDEIEADALKHSDRPRKFRME